MNGWFDVLSLVLNILFASGMGYVLIFFRVERKKRGAEADKVVLDVKSAEQALARMADEEDRATLLRVLDENKKYGEALHRAQDALQKALDERTGFILQINTLTRKLAIADQTLLESPRCDMLSCCQRIPPLPNRV